MHKIVVIAGSPTVLQKKRDLSEFDLVVKLNCIPDDEKYDAYISNRCDIWAFSSHIIEKKCIDKNLRNRRMFNENIIKLIYSKKQYMFRSLHKKLVNENIQNYEFIPKKFIRNVENINKFNSPLVMSTGFIILMFLMKKFKNSYIYLLGFTHQLNNDIHFYDNQEAFTIHDFEKEKIIIDNLVSNGKLFRIV